MPAQGATNGEAKVATGSAAKLSVSDVIAQTKAANGVFLNRSLSNVTFDGNGDTEEVARIATSYRSILGDLGENADREGLLKTPERAAKALLYFTKGYRQAVQGQYFLNVYLSMKMK